MVKKKDLGLTALIGGNYFSVRKVSSGIHKRKVKLRKYDPVARKHIEVTFGASKRIKAK